jgi:hypothetical protein
MYRDDPRISVIAFPDDNSVWAFIDNNKGLEWVIAGQKNPKFGELVTIGMTFDAAFYTCANITFHNKFSEYYFERDLEAEIKLYESLNPDDEPFIYVQDDPLREFSLDAGKFRQDLKIIYNDKSHRVFDYLTLLEKAEEIHIMESSIHTLVDSYRITTPKLHLHKYVRNYPDWCVPIGLNKWIEVR